MPVVDAVMIEQIRDASRRMVRELGFMKETLAATNLPPSAVHAILEIGARGALTAARLGQILNLEKSSVSRMLRKLVQAGELAEAASDVDGRVKHLTLTGQGWISFAALEAFGQRQVAAALGHLSPEQQGIVTAGLESYAQALAACRGASVPAVDPVEILSGYRPGVIGRAVDMHAAFYARTAGFGQVFESRIAAGLADFTARLDNPRNGLWVAVQSGRIVGTIAIDGEDMAPEAAHLRWFIVEDGRRGHGIGKRLLAQATAFCDRLPLPRTQLWTLQGLDAARRLYESFGFSLTEEGPGSQWGTRIVEQRFTRPAASHRSHEMP